MRRSMRKALLSLGVLCVLIGGIGAAVTWRSYERSFREVNTSKEVSAKNIKTVEINGVNHEVEIVESSSNQVEITCNGRIYKNSANKDAFSTEVKNGTLTITMKNDNPNNELDSFWSNFTYIPPFTFSFGGSPYHDLVVAIPNSVENVNVETVAGDISLAHSVFENVSLKTNMGSIYVSDSKINTLRLTNVAGDITVDSTVTQTADFTGNLGSIDMENVAGNITAKTSAGDIDYTGSGDTNLTFSTNLGSIDLELDEEPKGTKIKAETSLGNIEIFDYENVMECGSGQYTIDLSTASGDISVGD